MKGFSTTNSSRAVACLVAGLSVFLLPKAGAEAGYQLGWKNGDKLEGDLVSGNGDILVWKADAFSEPFSIQLDQLKHLSFPDSDKGQSSAGSFRFILRNGDRIMGDLLSIENEIVTVKSPRFVEPIRLNRADVYRMEHLRGNRMKLGGPLEIEDWISKGRNRKISEWESGIRGDLSTSQWHADLFREVEFPQAVEVSFTVETENDPPHFEVGLLADADKGPRVETWGDVLVLTYGSHFVPIQEIAKEMRSVSIRLFWNQKTGILRACSPAGNVLAELERVIIPGPVTDDGIVEKEFTRGFALVNHTTHMSLSHLKIREWNGEKIPVFDVNQPRIETSGGDSVFGLRQLRMNGDGTSLSINGKQMSIDSVSEIVFSPSDTITTAEAFDAATHIAWNDGTTASGSLLELSENRAVIRPDWSSTPIAAELNGARRILFPHPESKGETMPDRIEIGTSTLRGELQPGNNGKPPESLLAWRPAGSTNASPLADRVDARMVRDSFPAVSPIPSQSRLYLINGEMIVGKLISIDGTKVHFSSDMTGQISVDQKYVRAVDIGGAGMALQGFTDTGWQVFNQKENDVEMGEDTITLKGGGAGHPYLLVGDRIRFRGTWKQSYGAMTVRIFAGSGDESSASADIILAAQGNRMFVGKLKKGGAFSFSGEQVPIRENTAEFEIVARPEQIEIRVNDKPALSMPVEKEQRSGNGLYFQTGGGWQGWNNEENEISLSEFSVERTPGYVPRRIIEEKAKANALIIPRFHRKDPPTHILVAPNGDLLRGKLHALTGMKARFTSRSESFDLPLGRISSIVWLREDKNADDTKASGADEDEAEYAKKEAGQVREEYENFNITHQFLLRDGSRLKLAADRIDGNEFVGKSFVLGECTVTLRQIREMQVGPATPLFERLASADPVGYEDWTISYTPDPVIPGARGEMSSPLVGKTAPDFTVATMDESKFSVKANRGKVVVLDFWATWCGPCIKAMPEIREVIQSLPEDRVVFCAVNQGETPPLITQFLEFRGWQDTPVGLDYGMTVARDYKVDGLPHTVVIAKNGTVAWVHSGYDEEMKDDLSAAIQEELDK